MNLPVVGVVVLMAAPHNNLKDSAPAPGAPPENDIEATDTAPSQPTSPPEGIWDYGIELNDEGDYLTIASEVKDSPAYQADMRPGDLIIQINGESAREYTVGQAQQKLLAGDSITFLFRNSVTGKNQEVVLNKTLLAAGGPIVTEGRPFTSGMGAINDKAIRSYGVVMANNYNFVTGDDVSLRAAPNASSGVLAHLFKDSCLMPIGTDAPVNDMTNVLAFDPVTGKFHSGYVSVEYLRGSMPLSIPPTACTAIIQ